MQLVVLSTDEQWAELTAGDTALHYIRAAKPFSFLDYPQAAAFILLQDVEDAAYTQTAVPVFLNSVVTTLQQINGPQNLLRINGWNSFLQRPLWEVAGTVNDTVVAVLQHMGKTAVAVNDTPGFIAARVVAMIINEAYFALGDAVSNKSDINTAMKLGTNYPYGPFEWAEKIGVQHIYSLLQTLSAADSRCLPAPALVKEATLV